MPQSMHICMRPYEASQSYEKHLKKSTQASQFQPVCSMRNNEELYPQRIAWGFKGQKENKNSWHSISKSLLNDSLLGRRGVPPSQTERRTKFRSTRVNFTLTLSKALCQVAHVVREPFIGLLYPSPLLTCYYHHLYLTVCSIDTLAGKYNP